MVYPGDGATIMTAMGLEPADFRTTWNIVKMIVRDRYLGSTLGAFWVIMNPILLLGVYTFVFAFVFKARVPGSQNTFAYVVWLISGFVPYLAISDSLTNASSSITGNASLVKNIVFKTECLPVASTIAAGIPFLVGMLFLFILLMLDGNYFTYHVIMLVPLVILQFFFLIGLAFLLSALAVFIRDLVQIIPTLLLVIIFFSPIFYAVDMLPSLAQKITFFNPFFQMIQPYRDILINHRWPDWHGLIYLALLSIGINLIASVFFKRLKVYFTSVL